MFGWDHSGSRAPIAPRGPAACWGRSPQSCSPWESAAEHCWLGERSSCPLLYLLHLTNLMTGGMRSISNMALLAGSGQSTQEAFLHTPIPAGCCHSLLPRASRCRLARAGWDWHGRSSPSMGMDVSLCRSALGCAMGGRWVPRRFESITGCMGEGRVRADAGERGVPSARSLGGCPDSEPFWTWRGTRDGWP